MKRQAVGLKSVASVPSELVNQPTSSSTDLWLGPACVNQTFPKTHRNFVKLFFEKNYDEIRDLSAGGAQPNLNVGKLKALLIPIPPLEEQARIVARVTELRRLCADLRQRLVAIRTTQSHLAEALVDEVA